MLHPYKFLGRDMSGKLFFNFASCEPLSLKCKLLSDVTLQITRVVLGFAVSIWDVLYMALIFICIVSILFVVSVIWLYCIGGFNVMGVSNLACLVGLWLWFCSEPYGGSFCVLWWNGRNRCYMKQTGLKMLLYRFIQEKWMCFVE